jgi:hypothetical protein
MEPPEGAMESNELKPPKSSSCSENESLSSNVFSLVAVVPADDADEDPGWLAHASPTMPTKAARRRDAELLLGVERPLLGFLDSRGFLGHADTEAAASECRLRTAAEIPKKPVASAYGTTTSFAPAPSA